MSTLVRRIALQGLAGAGVLSIAVQGFLPLDDVTAAQPARGGGGVISSATTSQSEWLRQVELRKRRVDLSEGNADLRIEDAVAARRPKRVREEEQLLMLTPNRKHL